MNLKRDNKRRDSLILPSQNVYLFLLKHMGRLFLYLWVAVLLSEVYPPIKALLMGSAQALAALSSINLLLKRSKSMGAAFCSLILMSLAYLCMCLSNALHQEVKAFWIYLDQMVCQLFYIVWGLLEFYVRERLQSNGSAAPSNLSQQTKESRS